MYSGVYFHDQSGPPQKTEIDLVRKAFMSCEEDEVQQLISEAISISPTFPNSPYAGLAFMRAVNLGRLDIIHSLVQQGTSVNMQFRGKTMLQSAVMCNNIASLKFLLTFDDISVNQRNWNSKTALMEAAQGLPLCLKLLLDAGCDVEMLDHDGLTAFHYTLNNASMAKKDDVILCLNLFLKYGANLNTRDKLGQTCLHKAVKMNNVWFVKWLILNNCNLDLCGPKIRLDAIPQPPLKIARASALLLAFQQSNRMLLELLISCGCEFRKNHNVLNYRKDFILLHSSLQTALSNVDSLQHACRTVIRKHLSTNIIIESKLVNLPVVLQRYILCLDELSLSQSEFLKLVNNTHISQ